MQTEPISITSPLHQQSCVGCDAACCRSVSVQWEKPETAEDWDRIRWLILHKNIQIYEDHEGDWFIDFFTDCVHLRSDQRCGIYEHRPDICKEYANDECLKHGEDQYYNRIFKTQEDIDAYLACN